MYLSMVCGMFVCVSLSINVCMFTVSNALLMSNARVRIDLCIDKYQCMRLNN